MKNIATKQFQQLTDINLVWDFMVEVYDNRFSNGVAAPFFEYALTSSWMDKNYSHLSRLWLDDDKVVAFVFYENPVTNIFFNLRRGYEGTFHRRHGFWHYHRGNQRDRRIDFHIQRHHLL